MSGTAGPPADPGALVERAAALERRAMEGYRALAARFAGGEAGRRFGEMAEGEAAHFAILGLAADLARMSGAAPAADLAAEAAALGAAEPLVAALEAAAAGPADPAAGPAALIAAVEAAVRFESQELPRVAALVASLPDRAGSQARTGLGRTLPAHYAALEALGRLAGRDDLAAAARALAESAASL